MTLDLVIHGARNSCVVGIASVKEDGHDSATLLLPDYTKTQKTHPSYNARFRYWHKADVQTALMNVRFEGNNGHDADVTLCLLMTQSGHPTIFVNSFALCPILMSPLPIRLSGNGLKYL